MAEHEDISRNAIKILKRPFKRLAFYFKHGLSSGMSASGEWLIYNAQRFSPYKFRAYQPMPWIGLKTRKRDESTRQRWRAIEQNLGIDAGTALDIGSNLGYFVLRLAEQGFYRIGIDMAYGNVKIAQYAQRKAGIENAAFSVMAVTPDNIEILPAVDVVVFFSVWHHWIAAYGLESALRMLSITWRKTRHVMFFETGEDTEIQRFGITGKPADWVRSQLALTCTDATIRVIGEFDRGAHQKIRQTRTLFTVYRL